MSIISFIKPLFSILLPLALYIYLKLNPEYDRALVVPQGHFEVVSATALAALALAIAIGIAGIRKRNLQVIYTSLAFTSLAGLFSVHGLATPGFLVEANTLVGIAAQLSVLTMSFWLLLSALPTDNALTAWLGRRPAIILSLWTLIIVIFGVFSLQNIEMAEMIPVNQAPLRYLVAAVTILMALVASFRYWQSYRYSRFPFQITMAYAAGWIAVSQIIITTGQTFQLSWWIYHILLVLAVGLPVAGLIVQYRRGDSIPLAILGLFTQDPAERLEAAITPSVRALVAATEARDTYTAGHSHRVALGAVSLGGALNLSPQELRVLAQGSIIHDVGKLNVPDQILNKPGPLTPEERQQIETHPVTGYDLCTRLGFMGPELSIVRSHHERLDGSGYPDGLKGKQLSTLVRILGIVDVYDALTSDRSYRPPWSQAAAIKFLRENSPGLFDQRLVEIWITLVESNRVTEAALPGASLSLQQKSGAH
jgi:HD-GYP domain-containing protein (c-di-GMP phosphodiesterase class II)